MKLYSDPILRESRLIVALDVETARQAERLAAKLAGLVTIVKVGIPLFTAAGPALVTRLQRRGLEVFLDLKFHDIPTTVARAAAAATRLGVRMFTVHAAGGREMLSRCREAVHEASKTTRLPEPAILAVTVLTHLDEAALRRDLRVPGPLGRQVVHLARIARGTGLHGVVASPQEVQAVRRACGPDCLIVTPGIRPVPLTPPLSLEGRGSRVRISKWTDDQRRIATPAGALEAGADYLVIGRPIIEAKDPVHATEQIVKEIRCLPTSRS